MVPDAQLALALANVNLALSARFLGEMCIEILAMGFVMEKGTWLQDGWNELDLSIVMTSMAALISGQSLLQPLKMVCVLWPLWFVNQSPRLNLVAYALISSIPPLGDVMLISMFFWLTFSILGTQFFMGKFYTCPPSGPRGRRRDGLRQAYGALGVG